MPPLLLGLAASVAFFTILWVVSFALRNSMVSTSMPVVSSNSRRA